ncbi:MAG TPA: hypothetical protein PKD86_17760, partial [Gemmatales bacterium]|nr:hypothetical protein [Gemmatales bacterium]
MFKLNCPHCTKVVEIARGLAGQTTNCPECGGPFTVPIPPTPAPAPPAAPSSPADPLMETQPYVSMGRSSAPSSAPSSRPAARPTITAAHGFPWLPWVAPVGFVLIFLLMFMPWIAITSGSSLMMQQSGMSIAFGTVSGPNVVGEVSLVGASGLMIVFFLLVLVGFVLALAMLFLRFAPPHQLEPLGPWPDRLLPHRSVALLGLAGVLVFLLLLHSVMAYPVEGLVAGEGAAPVLAAGLKEHIEGPIKVLPGKGDLVALQWTRRTTWYALVWLMALATLVGALADWGLARPAVRFLPVLKIEW